jgi:hypothetical protein
MRHETKIASWLVASLLMAPMAAPAQLPGGMQMPGGASLPLGGLSKDALLKQAKELVADLTSMKSSGKLAPEQMKQADDLLPRANSLTSALEKPQVDAAELPKLASNLSDLQKQVGALKGLMK